MNAPATINFPVWAAIIDSETGEAFSNRHLWEGGSLTIEIIKSGRNPVVALYGEENAARHTIYFDLFGCAMYVGVGMAVTLEGK